MNKIFNVEEQQFIKDNYKGILVADLAKLMQEKFGKQFNCEQIKRFKVKNKLRSGISTRFYKDQIPHNLKQEGDEFKENRGYQRIKHNGKWMMKARYVYEQEYGELPNNYYVVLLDGNKDNLSLDNLMAVECRDKLVCKNKKLFTSNKEATKVGLLTAQLSNKLYDLEKKDEK